MTTAHRPTFDPARGKDAQRGPAYHQRLLPSHTHLKQRQAGQGGAADANKPRDLRKELLAAEAAVRAKKTGVPIEIDVEASREDEDASVKRRRLILEEAALVDADDDDEVEDAADSKEEGNGAEKKEDAAASVSEDSSDDDSDDDDDDEEDEEAELMRELAKIKAERAAAKAAEEAARAEQEQDQREYEIARGNPLLNGDNGGAGREYGVKRRWDDDVVFKNQARGTDEKSKGPAEFVNDLLRSDFHKRFMGRYVR